MSAAPREPPERRLSFAFAKRHGVLVRRDRRWRRRVRRAAPAPRRWRSPKCAAICACRCKLERVRRGDLRRAAARGLRGRLQTPCRRVEGLDDTTDLAHLAQDLPEQADLLESDDDAPIIRLINAVLTQAVKENASDIHVEPFENRLVIRFRVDGVLREVLQSKRAVAPLVVSRIKVMSKLDIAEKRLPQDGRISLRIAGRAVDVRVSTIPSGHGERVVLRIARQAGRPARPDRARHGPDAPRQLMDELIHKPHGIMLVTGPTGSGKTTTLYAGLERLNDNTRNIMTVEDPIEYYIDGIGQTQVNTKVEMTFARGLRAILRQDPDVVMVGEIRDLETAQIAVQASLTGHLVLSTLHTNTAVGAVTRLRDMGIEPFLLSSSLIGVLAQRLVRVLNPDTRAALQGRRVRAAAAEPRRRGRPVAELYRPGREPAAAIAAAPASTSSSSVDDHMRTMIHDGAAEQDLERYARTTTPSIRDDGRAQGAARRDHPRGSPARHARGLSSLMGAFEYTALDAGGTRTQGHPRGRHAKHVRQLLREQQLLPVTVTEVAQKEAKPPAAPSAAARRVSAADLALFTRQLATLVRAGLPLEESLLAVSQQTEKPRVQSIMLGVRARSWKATRSPMAFADFPQVFPEIYRATVSAGEQSGQLDGVLERLADYTESREQSWARRCCSAMLYPIVLIGHVLRDRLGPAGLRGAARWSRCSRPARRSCRSRRAS